MDENSFLSIPEDSTPFATARCSACEKQVLVHERLSEDGSIEQACLECDTLLLATDFCSLDEIEGLGYEVQDYDEESGEATCSSNCSGACATIKLNASN